MSDRIVYGTTAAKAKAPMRASAAYRLISGYHLR
jgi:hypothetical protein